MRNRSWILISACLLLATGACLLWLHENHQSGNTRTKLSALPKIATTAAQARSLTILSTNNVQAAGAAAAKAQQFHLRLSNTTRSIGELTRDPHAILLANALIDTDAKLDLSIPKNLQAPGEPGAYIVQATGQIDNSFRAMLAQSGAQIVSYIPNNAYLVNISSSGANLLAGNPMTQAVIPYEPYYKISASMPVTAGRKMLSSISTETNRAAAPSLLDLALKQAPLPAGTYLTLGLFNNDATATVAQIEKLGGQIVARDNSPFGPVVRVQPPADWIALAALPGVQIVEPYRPRVRANDLSRATVGVAADTQTTTNYMGLSGKNVIVEVNDTGIDGDPITGHPDLRGRVFGDSALSLVDTNGHGTHVAGIIAGDGSESTTVTNAQGSIMPPAAGQFRGMATNATLYSVAAINDAFTFLNFSDQYLQEAPALTNALISNNSWTYSDSSYDLSAASYDAAVRDALPEVTGSQPVLFVFAAGNNGGGGDDGNGGNADTILSPATAKNVITVGALEQARGITNVVAAHGQSNEVWQPMTDSSFEVAGYSSRGNVGVGIEGANGRFKPDVVAPGSFVISTRSSQWDEGAYYNPTNYNVTEFADLVDPGSRNFYSLLVPSNVVQIIIEAFPFTVSTSSVPALSILLWKGTDPRASLPDLIKTNMISIPPDSTLAPLGAGWTYAVSNATSDTIIYDLLVEIVTTNDNGNYFEVLSNLNNTLDGSPDSSVPPHYYRYESGTSMSAADVSGVLALMQDYFTNTLHATPSPALLKALLINGARPDGNYTYELQNTRNYEGWGLISLPNSLPAGITNVNNTTGESMLLLDQSPTNALATGDSHTYSVSFPDGSDGQFLPLQVTLTWTDPPGNPAAAIKLVNSLELIITNLDTGDVFIGNDIASGDTFNLPWDTNTPPNIDTINNVQNVFIPPLLGTNYTITVIGRSVNVNAVTAQTNNVVQDYALVISCGEGEVTNAFTVTDNGIVSSPTTDQQVAYIGGITAPLLNQFVGASSPLLGTNTVSIGTISVLDTNGNAVAAFPNFISNAVVTLGQTNQWHFYVVTNNGSASDFTNAAFITFLPDTLSVPRMGVFADATANATRPEADIEIYVASGPNASGLTNLDPNVISNCLHGTQVGLSSPAGIAGVFNGAAIGRGGTEFVADIRSTPSQVYYVGVKSEDQMASEYDFMSIFSRTPFSQMQNGNQLVNGQLVPVATIDGSPARPGVAYIFALAIFPMEVGQVTINSLQIWHQNFGDLVGTLSHNGVNSVLNNHDSLGNTFNSLPSVYDDSGSGNNPGSLSSDGPGSLRSFTGKQGIGPWILTEVDNSLTQTGLVQNFQLTVQPHKDLTKGITVVVQPGTWFYDFVDVPVGTYNLTVTAVDENPTGTPLKLGVKLGSLPTLADTNNLVLLNNSVTTPVIGKGNSISIGPPLTPGRYFVGVFNPDSTAHTVFIQALLSSSQSAISTLDYRSGGPAPILDDAVTTDSIFVTNTDIIQDFNVGLRVDHPRISDLVFHLISPDGTRYLLMENRGGTTTNGCGATIITTNMVNVSSSGDTNEDINSFPVGVASGTLVINYNFYTVPDQMTIYASTNNFTSPIFNTGMVSGAGRTNLSFNTASGFLTIIMNQFGNTNGLSGSDLWNYSAGGMQSNYLYLAFTDDTNRTTTPIKFAPPPFVPGTSIIPLNPVPTNIPVILGPILNTNNGHYYYLLGSNNWTGSEAWAKQMGGNLATVRNATENSWIFNTFNTFNTDAVYRDLWIGFYDPSMDEGGAAGHSTNFVWVSGEPITYTNWYPGEPSDSGGNEFYAYIYTFAFPGFWNDYRNDLVESSHPQNGVVEVIPQTTGRNLYYQPEEPMDGSSGKEGLNGLSAFGTWTLEVQDDRAGAANGSLLSWQLEFEFANTNFIPIPPIIPGQPVTNIIPPGGVVYLAVNVPVNADIATNILLFSTGPKNIWYDTNNPPTTNIFLFGGLSGSINLSTTGSAPTNLVPGSTYYIVEQNPSLVNTITNAFVVNFHFVAGLLGPFAFTQPAYAVTGTGAQLNGMATPNGLPATAWFQWGTSTAYGNQTPPVSVGTGTNVVYVANTISGLLPNVPYHFRLVVTNALGVTTGFDQILDEANVVAWGANYLGQTTVPAGLSNVVAVAGAYDHSLALKPNETAVAWGDNTFGQGTVPAALSNFLAVAGGAYYSMALENNETVASWGANILSQTNVPAGLNSVVEIAGGTYSSLALQSNGTVVAWGAGFFNLTNVPAGLSNVVAIAGGSYHNLAIRNDGTVTAWGDDSANQTNVPAGLTNAVAISAGSYHSLALRYDGTVVAWGDNSAGQTDVPAGLNNVVAIAAGGFHSLALKNDGTIVAWGDNSAGQKNVPSGVTNFVAIAAGYFQSLALTPQSLANLTIVLNLTNGVPLTNNIVPGSIVYYQVNVPANADFATNLLLFASAPLNVWFSSGTPTTNVFLFSGTNGFYTLSTNGTPPLVPGSTYYLGVQNTNNATVDYGVEVDFHLLNAGNPISGLSVTYTNIAGTNGFLLTWFAPTNDIFQVQWTDSLAPINWQFFTNFISYTGPQTATNGLFSFFDDGSQTPPGLPLVRFYRILLAASGSSTHTNLVFISSVTSTNISGTTNVVLAWSAPTNYLFEVQWTTNLATVITWQAFPNIIAYSTFVAPTNSLFDFFDDGSQGGLGPFKFYRLLLLP